MKTIDLILEIPKSSTLVGRRIMFWKQGLEPQVILHVEKEGFVNVQEDERPWVKRIKNTSLHHNAQYTAILTPEKEIRVIAVHNKSTGARYEWDDMAFMAVELDLDVCPRELYQ